MNKTHRELKKISDNQYMLYMDDEENRLHQEKGYSKHELKEAYESLKLNLMQTKQALDAAKKNAKSMKVELTEEEERILELMEKASKQSKYKELAQQIEGQEKDYEMYKSQMKEIETAIPEVLRSKK